MRLAGATRWTSRSSGASWPSPTTRRAPRAPPTLLAAPCNEGACTARRRARCARCALPCPMLAEHNGRARALGWPRRGPRVLGSPVWGLFLQCLAPAACAPSTSHIAQTTRRSPAPHAPARPAAGRGGRPWAGGRAGRRRANRLGLGRAGAVGGPAHAARVRGGLRVAHAHLQRPDALRALPHELRARPGAVQGGPTGGAPPAPGPPPPAGRPPERLLCGRGSGHACLAATYAARSMHAAAATRPRSGGCGAVARRRRACQPLKQSTDVECPALAQNKDSLGFLS